MNVRLSYKAIFSNIIYFSFAALDCKKKLNILSRRLACIISWMWCVEKRKFFMNEELGLTRVGGSDWVPVGTDQDLARQYNYSYNFHVSDARAVPFEAFAPHVVIQVLTNHVRHSRQLSCRPPRPFPRPPWRNHINISEYCLIVNCIPF